MIWCYYDGVPSYCVTVAAAVCLDAELSFAWVPGFVFSCQWFFNCCDFGILVEDGLIILLLCHLFSEAPVTFCFFGDFFFWPCLLACGILVL